MTAADEWGRAQAAAAPAWSEARWRTVCAILGRGVTAPDEQEDRNE